MTSDEEYLTALFDSLGDREKMLVLIFITRLLSGQNQYGKLYEGKKNWPKEMLEEHLDSIVYSLAWLLDLAEEKNGVAEPNG